jgi:predicted RNA-binding Zn ribbon-like protein
VEETTTFPLIGEPLAVDLANTLLEREEGSVDLLATPERLSAWCEAEGERLGVLDPAGFGGRLPEFLMLRAAIRELFRGLLDGESPLEGAVKEINAASARVPRFRKLSWPKTEDRRGGLRAETRDLVSEEANIALARIARSAIELAGDPEREFLRSCPAPGCPLIFCAENRRRRWCSTVCGNRVRVARHYRRHH